MVCAMVLPPELVQGDYYMDGGSVLVLVTDGAGTRYAITFPIDRKAVRNAYPAAQHGALGDPKAVPLKDSKRAKEIAIRLLRDYGDFTPDPRVDGSSGAEYALRGLTNLTSDVFQRATDRIKEFLR